MRKLFRTQVSDLRPGSTRCRARRHAADSLVRFRGNYGGYRGWLSSSCTRRDCLASLTERNPEYEQLRIPTSLSRFHCLQIRNNRFGIIDVHAELRHRGPQMAACGPDASHK